MARPPGHLWALAVVIAASAISTQAHSVGTLSPLPSSLSQQQGVLMETQDHQENEFKGKVRCVSAGSGGYRAIVGAMGMVHGITGGPAKGFQHFAGISGGAWAAYLLCAGRDISPLRQGDGAAGFESGKKFREAITAKDPTQFRAKWGAEMVHLMKEFGDTAQGEDGNCVDKVYAVEAHSTNKGKDCPASQCINVNSETTCDNDAKTSFREALWDALITSSAAATTTKAHAATLGIVKAPKHTVKGKDGYFYDMGLCQSSPWDVLLDKCDLIYDMDPASVGADTFAQSIPFAEKKGWKQESRVRLGGKKGNKYWGDLATFSKSSKTVKVFSVKLQHVHTGCTIGTLLGQTFPRSCIRTFHDNVSAWLRKHANEWESFMGKWTEAGNVPATP